MTVIYIYLGGPKLIRTQGYKIWRFVGAVLALFKNNISGKHSSLKQMCFFILDLIKYQLVSQSAS